jgi:hypothetical protein
MNTGFGLHCRPVQIFAPRSCSCKQAFPNTNRETYIDRAYEVLVASHDIGQTNTENDGEEPRAEETLPRLLWRNLDQRRAAEGNTTDIRKDVVCDDHGNRQEEPDHPLENVVDDKMSLAHNQEEGHVSPGKLCELELVMPLLERANEEDKT